MVSDVRLCVFPDNSLSSSACAPRATLRPSRASEISAVWSGSACGLMLPPTAPAGLSAAVAGAQRWVAAHARRQQRQPQQRQPAHTELLLAGVAGARVREVSLRVGHAVVQHALGAQHAAQPVDALLDGVGRVGALTPLVVLVVEHLAAVDAARALSVLASPAARRLLRLDRVLGVWLGEGGGGVGLLALRVLLPQHWVPVVLVASDEDVLARVDADDLLLVHVKAHVPPAAGGNLRPKPDRLRSCKYSQTPSIFLTLSVYLL